MPLTLYIDPKPERFNLKRSVGQREACHSRCSVIHPVGGHNHRSYFL
ncbi:MAG: hypothetical protein P8179_07070 [Candidatus Thiodiazotropha sp.]